MRDAVNYSFSRILRTLSSEIYLAYENKDHKVAEIHLHYVGASIFCTVLIEESETFDINNLLEALESDVVSSCIPDYEREDFSVVVFKAKEVSSFSYDEDNYEEYRAESNEEEDL